MSKQGEKEIFVYINNNIFHVTYVKKKKFINDTIRNDFHRKFLSKYIR